MISARGPSCERLLSPPVWSSLVCSPAQDTKAKHQDRQATWRDRSTTWQDTYTTWQESIGRASEAAVPVRDRRQSVANRLRADPLSLSNLPEHVYLQHVFVEPPRGFEPRTYALGVDDDSPSNRLP